MVILSHCTIRELGWRGYALLRLQSRYDALTSALLVGVPWGFWHAPLFWFQPERPAGFPILLILLAFVIIVVAIPIQMTWLYNSTGGSVKESGISREGVRYAREDISELRLLIIRDKYGPHGPDSDRPPTDRHGTNHSN